MTTGWQSLPCARDNRLHAGLFNELIAAANERNAETLQASALVEVEGGRVLRPELWSTLRARVEALIPWYCNPDAGFVRFTKASCLTAALGQADWTTPVIAGFMRPRATWFNEMQAVLSSLCWRHHYGDEAGSAGAELIIGLENEGWDYTWNELKRIYNLGLWQPWGASYLPPAELVNSCYGDESHAHYILNHTVATSAPFYLADLPVDAGKLMVTCQTYGGSSGVVSVYEGPNFTGVEHEVTIDGADPVILDIATPRTADYNRFSWRLKPATPDLDAYRPAPGASKGFWAIGRLLYRRNYTYN